MNINGEEENLTLLNIARSIQTFARLAKFEHIFEHMERIVTNILKAESIGLTTPTVNEYQPTADLKQIKNKFAEILNEDTDPQNMLTATPDETNTQVAIKNILTITIAWNKRLISDNVLSNLHQDFLNHAIAWVEKAIEQDPFADDLHLCVQHSSTSSSEEDTSTSHDSTELRAATPP
jgi:polygalacturonase